MNKSLVDQCIYYSTDFSLILAIYVDDILIFFSSTQRLKKLKDKLHSSFKMSELGAAHSCIGIQINQTGESIELDQTVNIEEVIKRFGMLDANSVLTPADVNVKLIIPAPEEAITDVPYQEAVGAPLFVAQVTRPDIMYAISRASQFNNCHSQIHWTAVKQIIRYLKGTKDHNLTFSRSAAHRVIVYSDLDWAGDVNT